MASWLHQPALAETESTNCLVLPSKIQAQNIRLACKEWLMNNRSLLLWRRRLQQHASWCSSSSACSAERYRWIEINNHVLNALSPPLPPLPLAPARRRLAYCKGAAAASHRCLPVRALRPLLGSGGTPRPPGPSSPPPRTPCAVPWAKTASATSSPAPTIIQPRRQCHKCTPPPLGTS